MKDQDLIPVTENSLRDYRNAREENQLNAVYVARWIEYKKRYFANFLSYAFDKEGNLYRRDFLKSDGWLMVNSFVEADLEGWG